MRRFSMSVGVSSFWILYGYSWRSFFKILHNDASERPSSWERSLEGLFRTPPERISHCIHIVKTSCSQLPARSGIFCLLVEILYWPCGLKSVYPMINLAFMRIIVKVKLSVKFCLHGFEWFCLQISSDAKYFFLRWLIHLWSDCIALILGVP